jgi:hypothetical protein
VHRVDAWLDGIPDPFACVSGGLRELMLLLSAPPLLSAISMVVLQHFGMKAFPALKTLALSCAAEEPEIFERFAVQPLPSLRCLQVDTQGCIRMALPILHSIANVCPHGVRLVLRDVDDRAGNDAFVRCLLGGMVIRASEL